jgi:hypothetical protein
LKPPPAHFQAEIRCEGLEAGQYAIAQPLTLDDLDARMLDVDIVTER